MIRLPLARRFTPQAALAWALLVCVWLLALLIVPCLLSMLPYVLLMALHRVPGSSQFVAIGMTSGMVIWVISALGIGAVPSLLQKRLSRWLLFRSGEITIGDDGTRFREGFRMRFVRWDEVVRIDRRGANDLHLTRTRGVRVRLSSNAPQELLTALTDAWVRHHDRRRLAAPPVVALTLADGDERNWLARARELLAARAYRSHEASVDDVVRVACDATAPPEQRIGSAVAIGAHGDEASKQRVRVAIDRTADPAVAEALRAAVDGAPDERVIARGIARRR